MVKSAYIHIPFCKSKCHYCSFVSYTNIERKEESLKALIEEINYYYEGEVLNTLYFGGGTPSLLSVSDFQKILRKFNISDKTEITVELNPDDVCYDFLRSLYDAGINRLSYGCQTFNDGILKIINRRHTSKQVLEAIEFSRKAGFKNISVDFIYGLPEQSCEMFVEDLERAIKIEIPHISLYGLTLEKGCYFYEYCKFKTDDEMQAQMYLAAIETLTNSGYEHYEISNFAKQNYYSRHNMNYWNNEEYYGFGVAAHGYKNRIRYGNKTDLDEYFANPAEHKEENFVTNSQKLEEEIFLGFRRISGINITQINSKFNIDFEEQYNDILKKYKELNLLVKTNDGYALTPNGILVSNIILADFLA